MFLLSLPFSLASAAELKFTNADESRAEFERSVKPFLTKHCVGCHGAKEPEGELDLTTLDPDMKSSTSGARWATLVEKLTKGEMPPEEKPRPDAAGLAATIDWAHAESKRANRNFTRRAAYENGNITPHSVLFDPKNIPPFDGESRVRRVSPEIYETFLKDAAKRPGTNQPFSPLGGTTFKDMGDPTIDEPVTATLFRNALIIVEGQTVHTVENGKIVKWNGARELQPLFDPQVAPTDAQLEAAITFQFKQILKRPPTDRELEKFVALLKRNMAEAGQVVGSRYALATVLMLTEAVFRMEVGSGQPDEKGRVRLAPREIAFAIGYALTDKGPDSQLLAAAATGGLGTDEGVTQQVRRLLDDAKTDKPRILRFFREYFGYDKASYVFKEANSGGGTIDFPGHDPGSLIADTDRLIEYILEQDRDVLRELLTTNKTFVAYRTAADWQKKLVEARKKFDAEKKANPEKYKNREFNPPVKMVCEAYGLSDFPEQQPVELPKDQRAGILTQPSWLVANSTTFDNHAIHRGKWIRERLLGNVVPDVPITVDAQLPNTPEKTLRERMAVTEQAYCWKCHQLMNDLAYPFEQFDHFGRYRAMDSVVDIEATAKLEGPRRNQTKRVMQDVPLNRSGLVAHVGDASLEGPVDGAVELMHKLAASERVEQVFVRHAFRYWLGRNESPGDAASLQAAHKAYQESGGSMKELLSALLTSESFLYRVPASPEPNAVPKAASKKANS
ncbi:DUF1588 domain-containing protein [Lignipirellula cremea]|uniref:Planctomycete cytochrome C n=1 Tax=Lignipirellula cremea TaxID=2528010 RepID=A0A518DXK1_9BACT|nr:DUF1588 domain-containing protein [Lignipirellula cremea]QDU96563.1 hypothetical protein Pla8534_43840 [Lignipirellula cremea]